jgi:hypothetical protein
MMRIHAMQQNQLAVGTNNLLQQKSKQASKQAKHHYFVLRFVASTLISSSVLFLAVLFLSPYPCFCCIASCLLLTHPLNHDKRTQTDFLHLHALCVIHLLGLPAGEDNFFLVCM